MEQQIDFYSYGTFYGDKQQYKYLRSLCHQLGWIKPHKTYKFVPDNVRLGKFVALNCKYKKPISKQSTEELSITISQLEQVLTK